MRVVASKSYATKELLALVEALINYFGEKPAVLDEALDQLFPACCVYQSDTHWQIFPFGRREDRCISIYVQLSK